MNDFGIGNIVVNNGGNIGETISAICIFLGIPLIVFGYLYLSKRQKHKIELLKYQRDILDIELKKDQIKLELMEAENKKYDQIIEEHSK